MFELMVIRRVPTYDFVVRTDASRAEVIAAITAALAQRNQPLEGSVDGGVVTCQRRVPERWWNRGENGRGVPEVSAEIIPRDDGGTDVLVRIDAALGLIAGALIALMFTIVYLANVSDVASGLSGLAIVAVGVVLALGGYFSETEIVVDTFRNILSSITSARPPAP